jgi:Na+/H+ antiporter NhaC
MIRPSLGALTGAVSRPLNDAMKVSPEKQAFLVHTTSTPVCVLLPLSGWGAFMIGLIEAQGVPNAPSVLIQSIPFNFYSLIAVFSILILTITGKDYGPMKEAEARMANIKTSDNKKESKDIDSELAITSTNASNMIVPMLTMIFSIIIVMAVTGKGNLIEGNGYGAILWGVALSLFVAGVMYIKQKIFTFQEYLDEVFKGTGSILPVVAILIFAFSMGGVVKELGTGEFLANSLSGFLTPSLLGALVFIIAALVSFSTGSSMGTHAVMMPLALPVAIAMGVSLPMVAAAVFGGGIFGDHTSPISDTTAMSCATTGCDVMAHIKTQLPYALSFAAVSVILYLVVGFIF